MLNSGEEVNMGYLFMLFSFFSCVLFIIGMIKPSWVICWGKSNYKTRKKIAITYFTAIIIFFVLASRTLDLNKLAIINNSQQTEILNSHHYEYSEYTGLKKASPKTSESRQDFTTKIMSNLQKVDWTLFSKIIQLLGNQKADIVQLFNGKIVRLESDQFYAGSYYLQDKLQCDLIWISIPGDYLSLGIQFSGSNQNVKNMENIIESKFEKKFLIREDYQDNHYKKGLYDKVYNHRKYDVEYIHDTHNDQSTLIINIHPHAIS